MPGPQEIYETTRAAMRRNTAMAETRVSFAEMAASASTPEARKAAEECMRVLREKFG